MELPDKYVTRSVVVNMGTMSVYRNAGFNGNGVINEVENPPNLSGGGGMMHDSHGRWRGARADTDARAKGRHRPAPADDGEERLRANDGGHVRLVI